MTSLYITIPKFTPLKITGRSAACVEIKNVELQRKISNKVFNSNVASSLQIQEFDLLSSISNNAMLGNANGALINIIETSGSISNNAMLGNANGSLVQQHHTDERNKSPITNDNPSPNQSAGLVDWNYVPQIEESNDRPDTSPRDLTRFKKSYSFTRNQPVRIRIYRR